MKKAFTLIELLAVIVLIAAIALIAIPNYFKIVEDNSDELYSVVENQIIEATKEYMTNNPSMYSDAKINSINISLEDLCAENYLDCPVINPRNNEELAGHVVVSYSSNYTYNFVLE